MKFLRKLSFLIYAMMFIIENNFISATDTESHQVLSFMTQSALIKQLNREIKSLNLVPKIKNITFDDYLNYSDINFNDTVLNLTQILISDMKFNTNVTLSTCLDNKLEFIGGKNFAFITFNANLKIFKSNGSEIINANCIFNITGTDLLLSKNFDFDVDKPKVTAKINLEFEIDKFMINNTEVENYQEFVDNALRSYLIKLIMPKINSKIQNELDNYYSNTYPNDYKFNLTTSQTEKDYVLDLNYIDYPETLRDNKTEKCGILFKRSGNLTGYYLNNTHEAVEFNQFNFEANVPQVFISRNLFDDLITSSMSNYYYRGILIQDIIDLLGLNTQMNIGTFSEILPNVLDSYSPTDEIAVHWALYDVKLNYKGGNLNNFNNLPLTGEVKFDCTLFANFNYPYVKQIYSFDANLNFDVNLIDQSNSSFNLIPSNIKIATINIREKYGFTKLEYLKNLVKQIIEAAVWTFDASLLVESIDLSKFYDNDPKVRIYTNGILIQ
jgi:hypothetical protein